MPTTVKPETRKLDGRDICCRFCPGREFRRSKIRESDYVFLLLMRYPVRCTHCRHRQWVDFAVAALSVASDTSLRRKTRGTASGWQDWTAEQHAAFGSPGPPGVADPEVEAASALAAGDPAAGREASPAGGGKSMPGGMPEPAASRLTITPPRKDHDENAIW
jgi:hypothetical protein